MKIRQQHLLILASNIYPHTQTHAWQAYYQKNNKELFAHVVKMFNLQYGLTPSQATQRLCRKKYFEHMMQCVTIIVVLQMESNK